MKKIRLFGLRLPVIQEDDCLAELILEEIDQNPRLGLQNDDILVIASKAISASDGQVISLDSVHPSRRALKLALECGLEPQFVELVIREADRILGVVPGAILTLSKGMVQANAGIDHSNTPPGTAILLPQASEASAKKIRAIIHKKTGANVAVIIGDSRTTPLRRGTSGVALGVSGLFPVIDDRGKTDLFGNQMRITWRAFADNCCCASQLLMGETDEQIPVVLIRGLKISFTGSNEMMISPEQCLFFGALFQNID